MRRRDFIAGLGAVSWPPAARAQQAERVPRVGFLTALAENSQVFRDSTVVLREGLSKAGWVEGRNLRLDVRSAGGDANRLRASATELVSLAPDVIVTNTRAATRAVQQQTRTIPIVVLGAGDVFEIGLVKSIARPEGNITGVTNAFSSFGGKWLELLKGAVPRLARVGVVYNAQISSGRGDYFLSIKEQAPALALEVHQIQFGDAVDLASGIRTFAAEPNGGLVIIPPALGGGGATILSLAVRHRLPTVYEIMPRAVEGVLISYGPNWAEMAQRTVSFVDRILRGAKVSDLPLEYPTRFDLVVNLKTAKAIDVTLPEPFLLRADEVIE